MALFEVDATATILSLLSYWLASVYLQQCWKLYKFSFFWTVGSNKVSSPLQLNKIVKPKDTGDRLLKNYLNFMPIVIHEIKVGLAIKVRDNENKFSFTCVWERDLNNIIISILTKFSS